MISPSQIQKPYKRSLDNLFFYASWELVLWQIFGTMTPDISPIITGIDSYTGNYTYSGVRDNYYNAKIGDNWNQRQIINGVSKPESTIAGLLNGSGLWIWGDLQLEAKKQYFDTGRARIVIFGHTHRGMVKGYNSNNYELLSGHLDSLPPRERLGYPTKILLTLRISRTERVDFLQVESILFNAKRVYLARRRKARELKKITFQDNILKEVF